MTDYLTTQIITYMGNKRKLLSKIEEIIVSLEKENGRKLTMGDGFSGSGVVSRLFKGHASKLYSNDIADYSETYYSIISWTLTNPFKGSFVLSKQSKSKSKPSSDHSSSSSKGFITDSSATCSRKGARRRGQAFFASMLFVMHEKQNVWPQAVVVMLLFLIV